MRDAALLIFAFEKEFAVKVTGYLCEYIVVKLMRQISRMDKPCYWKRQKSFFKFCRNINDTFSFVFGPYDYSWYVRNNFAQGQGY